MLHFLITIGICEIFVFLIALLYFQSRCIEPKSLSELSLPSSISIENSYNEDTFSFDILLGIKYFSKLKGSSEMLYNKLVSQTNYINNTIQICFLPCLIIASLFFIGMPKCLQSINAFLRILFLLGIIIITICVICVADTLVEHLSTSRRYNEIYNYLPETYRQLINNPMPENEYDFSHEDYCITILYSDYIHCLEKHFEFNRTRLSKGIGIIIISIIFLFFAFATLSQQFIFFD